MKAFKNWRRKVKKIFFIIRIYILNISLKKRLKNEEIWTKNLQNFITEFNKKNEKNHNYTIEKQIDEGAFGVLFEVSCLNEKYYRKINP